MSGNLLLRVAQYRSQKKLTPSITSTAQQKLQKKTTQVPIVYQRDASDSRQSHILCRNDFGYFVKSKIKSSETIDCKDSQNCAKKLVERNFDPAGVDDDDWMRFQFHNYQKQFCSTKYHRHSYATSESLFVVRHFTNFTIDQDSRRMTRNWIAFMFKKYFVWSIQGWIRWNRKDFSWSKTWIIQRDADDVKLSFCQMTSNFYFLAIA